MLAGSTGVPMHVIVAYRGDVSGTHAPKGRRGEPVASVTTAAEGRSSDLASRQRRYLVTMGIRLACLPLAVLVDGWLRWFFIIGAVVLPYIAVVIANATRRPSAGTISPVTPPVRPQLPPASRADDRIER